MGEALDPAQDIWPLFCDMCKCSPDAPTKNAAVERVNPFKDDGWIKAANEMWDQKWKHCSESTEEKIEEKEENKEGGTSTGNRNNDGKNEDAFLDLNNEE